MQVSADSASVGFGLSGGSSVELVKFELFLGAGLQEVDLHGVVVVHEQPPARVDEVPALAFRFVSLSGSETAHRDLTRRQKVNSRDSFVSYSHKSFLSLNIDTVEAGAVLKERLVGRSHGQFKFRQFGEHTKEPVLVLQGLHTPKCSLLEHI